MQKRTEDREKGLMTSGGIYRQILYFSIPLLLGNLFQLMDYLLRDAYFTGTKYGEFDLERILRTMSIECEVGGIGGTEDGVTSAGELADPKECATIAALGVDFLAAGIGNIHGIYPANWAGLNFDRLGEIQKAVNGKPLVLHGGSGIPFEQVHKAITLGVSKVNVNTELQLVFAKATREYIEAGKDQIGKGYDPRKELKPGCEAITKQVEEMIEAFGSKDKA